MSDLSLIVTDSVGMSEICFGGCEANAVITLDIGVILKDERQIDISLDTEIA